MEKQEIVALCCEENKAKKGVRMIQNNAINKQTES